MYAIRALTHKNKLCRSFKLVVGRKRGPHIGYVKAKFGYFNNFYTPFFGGVSYLPFGDKRITYIRESGYLESNRAAGRGVGDAIGANVREVKSRRHY